MLHPFIPLTHRQYEVMHCIAEGMCDKEISSALDLSIRTVKNHVQAIEYRLGVKNRTSIAVYGLTGWLPDYSAKRRGDREDNNDLIECIDFTRRSLDYGR